MSDDAQVNLKPGDVLAGKYRVERVLGAGGMGVVVAAHHLQLDEKVALKFLLPQAARSPGAIARFLQEARAAAKVKSEHVARVIDVGQLDDGSPYMVMEYLDGRDLAAWLEQHGALPVPQAVDFVLQACEALADAHALGIVHRDLKPANLFCIERSDGQASIKVLDFGISKVMTPGAAGHGMTRTASLMGSPLYMSPEHMKSTKNVDARSDIWSLGIILFELLTGQRPFDGEAVTELTIKVISEPTPSLRAFRRDAPPGLEQVVTKCLEKDRENRFQTVGELAVALKDFGSKDARVSVERVLGTLRKAGMSADVLPPSVGAVKAAVPAASGITPQTGGSWGNTAPETRPRGKAVAGIAAAITLGVVVVATALVVRRAGAPATVDGTSAAASAPPAALAPSSSVPSSPVAQAPAVPVPAVTASTAVAAPVAPATATAAPAPSPARATGGARGGARPGPARQTPAAAAAPAAPAATAAPSPPPAAKPNCATPYTVDASGERHYKPECL